MCSMGAELRIVRPSGFKADHSNMALSFLLLMEEG